MKQLFHERGPYHIETSPFICRANQWNLFYTIEISLMKELLALEIIDSKIIKPLPVINKKRHLKIFAKPLWRINISRKLICLAFFMIYWLK